MWPIQMGYKVIHHTYIWLDSGWVVYFKLHMVYLFLIKLSIRREKWGLNEVCKKVGFRLGAWWIQFQTRNMCLGSQVDPDTIQNHDEIENDITHKRGSQTSSH